MDWQEEKYWSMILITPLYTCRQPSDSDSIVDLVPASQHSSKQRIVQESLDSTLEGELFGWDKNHPIMDIMSGEMSVFSGQNANIHVFFVMLTQSRELKKFFRTSSQIMPWLDLLSNFWNFETEKKKSDQVFM